MSNDGRVKRHQRLRKKLQGTKQRPRVCIFRSINNLSAQLIDDLDGKTILGISTNSPDVKSKIKNGGNVKAAAALGEIFAKKAIESGFQAIVFDRAGYQYHGRVKAFAESCRKNGLKF